MSPVDRKRTSVARCLNHRGLGWIHEIKHDGILARRYAKVRLFTRARDVDRAAGYRTGFRAYSRWLPRDIFSLDVPTIFSGDTVKVFRSFRPVS
jgi:hypothetical protein